ncbi:MAG: hypothetical protein QOH90_2416, partial [Actinomycetota bacterium]|nr:hypothetical protein [Actinomycetota bacterium]
PLYSCTFTSDELSREEVERLVDEQLVGGCFAVGGIAGTNQLAVRTEGGCKTKVPTSRPRAKVKVDGSHLTWTKSPIERAVADLKTIGYWAPLTKGLGFIRLTEESGKGPLADAHISYDSSAKYCFVRVFRDEIRHEMSDMDGATRRELWARLLGHEISHCLGYGKGERFARAWGHRIGEAFSSEILEKTSG